MELLKVNEFASRYNLSVSTVRAMCQKGDLPAAKIGVGWRIDAEKAEGVLSVLFDKKGPQKRQNCVKRRIIARPKQGFDFAAELAKLRGK